MQEVEDAQMIRRSVIDRFEKAILPGLSEEERRTNLHFVIVGGGPTGVEFAAELHDFFTEDLVKIYPMVKHLVKISLIQSGDHILNTYVITHLCLWLRAQEKNDFFNNKAIFFFLQI